MAYICEWTSASRILGFVDDVLLVTGSREYLRNKISDLIVRARKCGLEVHAGKKKMMTNLLDS